MLPHAFRRQGRPTVLGHRGAPRQRPENTLESFELALADGADGIELDVMRCQSGELVVVHDPVLTRLAGQPLAVRKTPWSTLRSLDVGSHLDPRFAAARLPLLGELLAALPRTALINIELKDTGFPDFGLAYAVADLLSGLPSCERFLVSSFHPWLLATFTRALPTVATAFLFGEAQRFGAQRARLARFAHATALNPSLALCTATSLRWWRAQHYGLCVWTVDEPAVAQALFTAGVDCVISNEPGAVAAAFRPHG